MASPTWWTWVWASSRHWWWTGKPDVLQSKRSQKVRHYWATQLNWTECSTFTASSFRIWNSSTGIPSPPLALFVVMLPKALLTSHCRMSRWVIIPSWLSGLWRSFLYSSSVYQRPDSSKLLAMCFWNENRVQMEKGWQEEEEVTKKKERKEREIEQSFGKPAS